MNPEARANSDANKYIRNLGKQAERDRQTALDNLSLGTVDPSDLAALTRANVLAQQADTLQDHSNRLGAFEGLKMYEQNLAQDFLGFVQISHSTSSMARTVAEITYETTHILYREVKQFLQMVENLVH